MIWASASASLPGHRSSAIGVVRVEGKSAWQLDNYLFDNYKIHSTSLTWEKIEGVRITPNVYTTTRDLDRLIAGISEFAKT